MENVVSLSIKGRAISVPAHNVAGIPVVVTGRWLRVAAIHDESWREAEIASNAPAFLDALKQAEVPADIFTFSQRLPDTTPKYRFPYVMGNLAVAPTTDFKDWWENRLPQETRKHVRKSQKLNVVVRETEYNDTLIQGLKAIYDESPFRQGRRFWHYGKSLETIRHENASYLDRSILIGAYCGDELIGFLKAVRIDKSAHVMQIIAKAAHADKKTTNALIAKAIETCATRGIAHFVYGQYIYGGNAAAQLTEFKRRNGFEMVELPRYYVPLTAKGRIAVKTGLHLGPRQLLPRWLDNLLLESRAKYYRWQMNLPRNSRPPVAAS